MSRSTHQFVLEAVQKGWTGLHNSLAGITLDVRALGNSADKTSHNFKQLAGGYTAIIGARYAAKGIGAIVKPAMVAETAIKKLSAVTGAAGADLVKFHGAAIHAAEISPYAVPEMLDTLTKLRLVTGDNVSAIKGLDTVAKFAMASFNKLTTEQAAETFGQISRGFNMNADQTIESMEKLAGAARGTGLQIHELSPVMAKLSQMAGITGGSFDDVLTTLALTRRGFHSTESAATNLIRLGIQLKRDKTQEILARNHHIDVIDNETGQMRSMKDIMLDLTDAYKVNDVAVRRSLEAAFGTRSGIKPLISMLNHLTSLGDAGARYGEIQKNIANGGKVLDDQSQAYLATLNAQIELFKQAVENVAAAVGTTLLPVMTKFMTMTTWIIKAFRWLFEKIPVVKSLAAWGVGLVGVTAAVIALKAAISGIGIIMGSVLAMSGIAVSALTPVLITAAGLVAMFVLMDAAIALVEKTFLGHAIESLSVLESFADLYYSLINWDTDGYAKHNIEVAKQHKALAQEAEKKAQKEKKARDDELAAAVQKRKMLIQGAEISSHRFHIANEETLSVLNEIKGLATWKPQIMKESAARAAMSKLGSVRGFGAQETAAAKMAIGRTMPDVLRLVRKSLSAEGITASEHIEGARKAETVLNLMKDLEARRPGSIGKSVIESFAKNYVNPFIEMGSKANIAASSQLAAYKRGAVEAQSNNFRRDFKSTGPVFTENSTGGLPQSILPGAPGGAPAAAAKETTETLLKKSTVEQEKQSGFLKRLVDALAEDKVLRVKVEGDSPDPLGGGGGVGGMISSFLGG